MGYIWSDLVGYIYVIAFSSVCGYVLASRSGLGIPEVLVGLATGFPGLLTQKYRTRCPMVM